MLNSSTGLACEQADFSKLIADQIKNRGAQFSETQRQHPAEAGICIYATSWIEANDNSEDGGNLGVYVATYKKGTTQKIADLHYNLSEQIWYPPTINIDPVKFRLTPKITAFGVRVSWSFLGGTFGMDKTQLDLIVPAATNNLKTILSVPIDQHSYSRNCPTVCKDEEQAEDCHLNCEAESTDSNAKGIVIIGEKQQMGYQDIIVKTAETLSDPNGKAADIKQQSVVRYSWDGSKYIEKSANKH